MKTVYLERVFFDYKQTLGILYFAEENGLIHIYRTLELAWNNNQPNISCIPAGSYTCKYTVSPHLTQKLGKIVSTYEVLNVTNRSGIRIHSANYYNELLGCIALGTATSDLNKDGELDVVGSVQAVSEFETLMNKEDFTLFVRFSS